MLPCDRSVVVPLYHDIFGLAGGNRHFEACAWLGHQRHHVLHVLLLTRAQILNLRQCWNGGVVVVTSFVGTGTGGGSTTVTVLVEAGAGGVATSPIGGSVAMVFVSPVVVVWDSSRLHPENSSAPRKMTCTATMIITI